MSVVELPRRERAVQAWLRGDVLVTGLLPGCCQAQDAIAVPELDRF